jgi:hypothetical protein
MLQLRLPAALAALLALAPAGAFAQTPPPGDTPAPAPTAPAAPTATAGPGVVKIDIVETVEGKASIENLAAYFIRKKLREAGFTAWSARPIRADQVQPRPADAPPADPKAEKPEPDLVVKGKVTVDVSRVSTFYGQSLAFAYEAHADLEVAPAAGGKPDKIEDRDEWARSAQDAARSECLKRISLFAAADVMKTPGVRARLPEKSKAAVDAFISDLEKKRGDNGNPEPPPANPVPGEGGSKKGKGGK